MQFYPPEISRRFHTPESAGEPVGANAAGTGASFVCGAVIRFFLHIEPAEKTILDIGYKTNGCGFMIAAAEILADMVRGRRLVDMHGLDRDELTDEIEKRLERFPAGRRHCLEVGLDALQAALADFRARQLEEFAGEKALICTCFGVSEETVERVIAENRCGSVEEVGDLCRAGTGCGSCQFLIQELLDIYWNEKT